MKKISKNLIKIIKLLNDGDYHDGPSIGQYLNITRAAVWKIIKKLITYKIPIHSLKGKGYLLTEPLILLDTSVIKPAINTKAIQLEIFEQINSTNDYLRKFHSQDNKVHICIAEMQTEGKGRLQRNWYSPFGQNIYLSLRHPFHKDISELSGLSLIMGLAICKAIENVCEISTNLYVKWPNDIICYDKKLGGILVEIQAETHGFCNIIIGVGLNVNMQQGDEVDIPQNWTSIINLNKQYQDRNPLAAELINQIIYYFALFESKGFKSFLKEWQTRDYLQNQFVQLKTSTIEYHGIGAGINESGHLLLTLADKTIKAFSSGDTTILK